MKPLYKDHPWNETKVATTDYIVYKLVYMVKKRLYKLLVAAFIEGFGLSRG